MKFIKGLGCFAILLFTLFLPVNAHAEEGAGFTVTPVLGKGQTDPAAGYFSIKGEKKYKLSSNGSCSEFDRK